MIAAEEGHLPYEYVDSFERFGETQQPEKEKFYSSLSGKGITDEEYAHAKQVWETLRCRNLGDYHDLYVETDSLLLGDVFENFRNVFPEEIRALPCALLQRTRLEFRCSTEKDRSRPGVSHRHGHASDDRGECGEAYQC